jgi:hypothetical protein
MGQEPGPVDDKVTVQDLVVQTAMAFGQGAVDRTITTNASRLLRSYFKPRFEHHLEHYKEHRLAILAYARGLGWYAATVAASRGRSIIDAVDVRVGLDKFPCPIAPPILQFLEQLRGKEPGA